MMYFEGFFTGAALAVILVAKWECRELRSSIKSYEQK